MYKEEHHQSYLLLGLDMFQVEEVELGRMEK